MDLCFIMLGWIRMTPTLIFFLSILYALCMVKKKKKKDTKLWKQIKVVRAVNSRPLGNSVGQVKFSA